MPHQSYQHFRYQIIAKDFFDNRSQKADNDECYYKYLPAPELFSVDTDPVVEDYIRVVWSKISTDSNISRWWNGEAINYYVQWIDTTVDGLGKDRLSTYKITPDTFITIPENIINPNNAHVSYYFHVKAMAIDSINNCAIQSSWSNVDSIVLGNVFYSDKGDINSDVSDLTVDVVPDKFELMQNYPNPFNFSTIIKFSLPKSCWVEISLYNIVGEKVATLIDQYKNYGYYTLKIESSGIAFLNISSGIYFYELKTDYYREIKKCVFLK